MRCSFSCNPNTHIAFQPSALPDSQLASGELKRNALGAVFGGSFEKIATAERLEIFWEFSLQTHQASEAQSLPGMPNGVVIRHVLQADLKQAADDIPVT